MPPLYPSDPRRLITLVDLRCPGTERRLVRELAGWRGFAHAERLASDRVALVMRPGGASGLSR